MRKAGCGLCAAHRLGPAPNLSPYAGRGECFTPPRRDGVLPSSRHATRRMRFATTRRDGDPLLSPLAGRRWVRGPGDEPHTGRSTMPAAPEPLTS
jgi:hypothetical protein